MLSVAFPPGCGLQRLNGTWRSDLLKTAPFGISAFGEDQAGNLYVADYPGGIFIELPVPKGEPEGIEVTLFKQYPGISPAAI